MTAALSLSAAATSVWAKSQRAPGGAVEGSLPLWQHLDDAAGIARELWDRWLPAATRTAISSAMPRGEKDGRLALCWLAGIHDLGKASPAFAVQVSQLAQPMREAGLAMPETLSDRAIAPHALVGQYLLTNWLTERGWSKQTANTYAVVVGGHHGSPPDAGNLQALVHRSDLVGEGRWSDVQREFLERSVHRLNLTEALDRWQHARLPVTSQALLTSAVIVADWLASNTDFFPYESCQTQQTRVTDAWHRLQLPGPWRSRSADPLPDFAQRFGLPPNASPRPLQTEVVRLAQQLTDPGLLIIEAPMGEGKTEAALLGAEVLAARSGAGGVFVALPTQATSNAMFRRVSEWLRALPGMAGAEHPVTLAHGKAHLDEEFQLLKSAGRFREIATDEPTGSFRHRHDLIAHSWFTGRKKGALAHSVIGTIDQVLLGALKARHNMLRHLAFAGKVMILDEVHAYDVFMNAFLLRTIEWLGAYRIPTILLSATLPADRRAELVGSYQRGWQTQSEAVVAQHQLPEQIGYPVLIGVGGTEPPVVRAVAAAPRRTPVRLRRLADDLPALAAVLGEQLADGGCATVIRNTVRRVQETARFLAEALPDADITVLHSRYLGPDRTRIEKELIARFGPSGTANRNGRPQIVVASQVIEQSLDLDFDLMVTDLAPADLVLQRVGRLHRHQRGAGQAERAPGLRTAECLITGVDWQHIPPKPDRGSCKVYEGYPLYAALATLGPYLDGDRQLVLPDDISPVVQAAYRWPLAMPDEWTAEITTLWQRFDESQQNRIEEAGKFRIGAPQRTGDLIGWHRAGVGNGGDEERGAGHVRDGLPGLEVIVVQRDADGGLITPTWLARDAGRSIPVDHQVTPWRFAQLIASCTLPLPPALTMPNSIDRVIGELEQNHFAGWQLTHQLAGQLVLVLDEHRCAELAGHLLTYHPDYGLEYQRVR